MSIHPASETTLNALHLEKALIAQQALYAGAKMLAAPIGEKRDEARKSLFPGLFQAVPDPRNPQTIDAVKAPYGTCQFFVPQEGDICFVAGDIHGDLESLVACADRALGECEEGGACAGRRPILFILGDLIDRGPNSAECIAFVLRLALGKDDQRQDLRVLLVRGDHDVALNSLADGRITASVSPADFADRFAEDESADSLCSADAYLARAFVRFVQLCCPASVLLPNGILMAHGAVPHSDLQARFGMDLTLWSAPCAQDFSWCRLRTDKPSKAPNRYSKTSEMGFQNFASFVEMLNGFSFMQAKKERDYQMEPVSVFINGHEHCENGYKACAVPLSNGNCVVHNLTSFAPRNLVGEVTTPVYLLRLDGQEVAPIVVTPAGKHLCHDAPDESSPVAKQEEAALCSVSSDGDSHEQLANEGLHNPCANAEISSVESPTPPCEAGNADETAPKPDGIPSAGHSEASPTHGNCGEPERTDPVAERPSLIKRIFGK